MPRSLAVETAVITEGTIDEDPGTCSRRPGSINSFFIRICGSKVFIVICEFGINDD